MSLSRSRAVIAVAAVAAVIASGLPGMTGGATAVAATRAAPSSGLGARLRPEAAAVPVHTRGTFDLDRGWRFALVNTTGVDDPTGAYGAAATPGFDDSSWRQVDLPHDWSIEQNPTAGPGTTSGTGFLPGGLGW